MAAWGGNVRGPSRARGARKRVRGRGRCRRCRDGPALGPHAPAPTHAPARGPSAYRPPSLEPRRGRGRPLLRAKRRHDVLLACLRRSRISTCLPLWFVFFIPCYYPRIFIFIFQNISIFRLRAVQSYVQCAFSYGSYFMFHYPSLCVFSFLKIRCIFSIIY